ncbi:MAG: hypothetical protein ACRC8W_21715 [Plesiomonas shigelloides]
MAVQQFTVGNTTYNAAMASAVDQDRLLSMLTSSIMERAFVAASNPKPVPMDDKVLVPMFLAMPQELKSQVAPILIARCTIAGGTQTVTVADFGGRMIEYNKLLSALLVWNLADFFTYLDDVLNDARQAAQPAPAPSTGT